MFYLEEIFWDIWNSEGWSWSEYYHYQLVSDIKLDDGDTLIIRRAFAAGLKFVRNKLKSKHHASSNTKGTQNGRK